MIEKIGTFDIESNKWIHFEVMGCYDGERYETFHRQTKTESYHGIIKRFLKHITNKRYSGYTWYAHNGGKFDFLFILEDIMDSGFQFQILETNGSIISIDIITRNGKITIADSYHLLRASLKALTESFNVAHKKKDYDVMKGVSWHDKKLMQYLENDCIGLYECLVSFRKILGVSKLRLTIASQALQVFRDQLGDETELLTMPIAYENDLRDNFYAGGRVELYKGMGTVNIYDVNSLYPSVMLNEMPLGEVFKTNSYRKGYIGFYCVEILDTPDWYISPLMLKGGKCFFPNGRGIYYMSSDTLEMLIHDYGIRYKILYGYYFKKREYLFNNYIERFYKEKSEYYGQARGIIAKFLLNALYGKFAQKRLRETITTMRNAGKNRFTDFQPESGLGLVLVLKESKSTFILPYLSAYITELARLKHFLLMREDEKNIYYCDTDSIFSSSNYYDRYVSKKIGDLSFKGKYNFIGLGNKVYSLKSKKESIVVFKGFNGSEFSHNDFRNALHHIFQPEKFITLLGSTNERILSFRQCFTRENGIIDTAGKFLKMVSIHKQLKTVYDKRKIFRNKKFYFDSQPLQYSEIKDNE